MTDLTRRGVLRAGTAGVAALAVPSGQVFAQAAPPKRGGTVVIATVRRRPRSMRRSRPRRLRATSACTCTKPYTPATRTPRRCPTRPGRQSPGWPDLCLHDPPGVTFHNGKTMGSARCGRLDRAVSEGRRVAGAAQRDRHHPGQRPARGDDQPQERPVDLPRQPLVPPRADRDLSGEEAAKPPKDRVIGTGPYKFVEYVPDSHVTLERFDGYAPNAATRTGTASPAARKSISTGISRFMPEAGAQVAALQPARRVRGERQRLAAKQLAEAAYGSTRRCRSAAGYEIQPRARLRPATSTSGAPSAASTWKRSWRSPFPTSTCWMAAGCSRARPIIPRRASISTTRPTWTRPRRCWPIELQGRELTFIVDDYRPDVDTATNIAQQLAEIGIKIDIRVSDWATV